MSENAAQPLELPPGDWLPPDQGHRVWWCEGGAPEGLPVLIVHGGPGGASRVEPTRWFDGLPVRWIAIDQRACGRSTPRAATAGNDLSALLHDMERLRTRLGLSRWGVAGGSWGARVALAYWQAHAERVSGLMLRSPFFGSPEETSRYVETWRDWLGEAGVQFVGEAAVDGLESLYRDATRLLSDGALSAQASVAQARLAQAWSAYDDAQSAPGGVAATGARFEIARLPKADDALAVWQVHRHFAIDRWGAAQGHVPGVPAPWWQALPEGAAARTLAERGPIHLVWGAADATCDPAAARHCAARLPGARAREVAGAGHRMSDPLLAPALRETARDWVQALSD